MTLVKVSYVQCRDYNDLCPLRKVSVTLPCTRSNRSRRFGSNYKSWKCLSWAHAWLTCDAFTNKLIFNRCIALNKLAFDVSDDALITSNVVHYILTLIFAIHRKNSFQQWIIYVLKNNSQHYGWTVLSNALFFFQMASIICTYRLVGIFVENSDYFLVDYRIFFIAIWSVIFILLVSAFFWFVIQRVLLQNIWANQLLNIFLSYFLNSECKFNSTSP